MERTIVPERMPRTAKSEARLPRARAHDGHYDSEGAASKKDGTPGKRHAIVWNL